MKAAIVLGVVLLGGAAFAGPRVAISQVSVGHGKARLVAKVRAPLARYQPADFALVVDGGKPLAAAKVDDYTSASGEQLSVVLVAQSTPAMLSGPAVDAGADLPAALKSLLPAGPADTQFALVTYGHDATLRQEFGRREAFAGLTLAPEADGANVDAALHDAIYALVPRAGRKVVIVVGDGAGSLASDVKTLLLQNDIELYAMVLSTDAAADKSPLAGLDDLGEVALLTPELLKGKADNLRHMLDWYYVVEFAGAGLPLDGANHKLTISAKTVPSPERIVRLAVAEAAPAVAAVTAPPATVAEQHSSSSMVPVVVGGGVGLSLVIGAVVFTTRRKKHLALVAPADAIATAKTGAFPAGTPVPPPIAARGPTLAIVPGTVAMSPSDALATKAMDVSPADGSGSTMFLDPGLAAWLVPMNGSRRDETLQLPIDGATTVGSAGNCGLVIADPHMSKLHARIVADSGKFTIVDAGSRNGVMVNGKKVQSMLLADNDTVKLGETELRFKSTR